MSVEPTVPRVIDVSLVRELVSAQFPEWAHLPIERVEPNGWDNRTFRLGSEMSVRLPSHERYAAQVEKEQAWLPRLGPLLPLAIPVPIACGRPGEGYPWSWSIYRWLPGETATVGRVDDLDAFASELAGFLRALHRIDASDGPAAGLHNFFRGGSLKVWDSETREAIEASGTRIDRTAVTVVWETALETTWEDAPVWVHGDLVPTNLLVYEDGLSAVIDFGCSGVGDPACDLAIAWLFFSGRSRAAFRERLELDASTWARARGWTLWKRLVALANDPSDRESKRVIHELIAEHRSEWG
ncbi:MAG: aminoglycoside phosphotransferase family protein [Gemmatimonadetes bacterium]|nr:aminoglycoside phosphotransferase family protein [Gemmatimonadota bacterium]